MATSIASIKAVLQLSEASIKTADDAWTMCHTAMAAACALQQPGLQANSDSEVLHAQCIEVLTRMVQSHQAWSTAPAFQALAFAMQHAPQGVFLQGCEELSPEIYSAARRDDEATTRAACACCRSFTDRLLQYLASSSTRTAAAQSLAKVVAAAMHLIKREGSTASQEEGYQLIVELARCMPQVLKSQTIAVGSACIAAISQPKVATRLPMAVRLRAAHALACLALPSISSEGWALHVHGLLQVAHGALAALPMPLKDSELAQAARDVLGPATSAPWHAMTMPTADTSFAETMQMVTLLLHCLGCILAERAPALAPLPMSALVLLASRLLSLRVATSAAAGTSPLQACQWSVCSGALLAAGVLLLCPCMHPAAYWCTLEFDVLRMLPAARC
jgi:hypothetical protein